MKGSASACELLIVGGDDVRRLLSMAECIAAVDRAMRVVSRGGVNLPLRTVIKVPGVPTLCGVMPGYLAEPASLGAKVIAINPENARRGLSSHTGIVVLFDAQLGVPKAIVDAAAITGLRTAAASAVATDILALPDAADLAVLGAGEQAAAHVEAMAQVRQLRSVRVWARVREKALAFATRETEQLGLPIEVVSSVSEAVTGATIVCATTGSREPVLQGCWVGAGTHVNLVGASTPDAREADEILVRQASYFVDFIPSALAQAGELRAAFPSGEEAARHIRGEIGAVLDGTVAGRTSAAEVTIYKSLGIAAQDLASAHLIYERARQHGLGTRAFL